MKEMRVTRRAFLSGAGGAAGWAWAAAWWPALLATGAAAAGDRDRGAAFSRLGAGEAADLEAVAARIIPADDGTPGAREAGVIRFIDRALGDFFAPRAASLRSGLAELNARAAAAGAPRFSALPPAEQDRLLGEVEQGNFFQAMRYLTVAGMFAMPEHGGNRGHAGWRLLGFDHRHGWQAPFGHYDEAADGEEAEHGRA